MGNFLRRSAIAIGVMSIAAPGSGLANTTRGHIEPLDGPVYHVRMRDVIAGGYFATDVSAGLPIPSGILHRIKVRLGLADQRVLIAAWSSPKARRYTSARHCNVVDGYVDYYAKVRPAQIHSNVNGMRLTREEGRLPLYYIDDLRLVDRHACDSGRGRSRS